MICSMKKTTVVALAACAALDAAGQAVQGFAFEVDKPPFRVSIPDLPAMKMGPHPGAATHPHLRYLGSEGDYTISIITPTADPGMSAQDCATFSVRTLGERPSVPKEVFRARLNPTTYVAMYPARMEGFVQLHAHFLSAAGGSHCVEVHASKVVRSEEDIRRWFKESFRNARIEPK